MAPSMRIVLGTATPGGGFPLYGDTVAAVINEVDDSLHVETRNTKGSTENVPLLESGQVDLGLVQGEVAHEALSGIGRPPANLRILTAMYSTAGMFVVRADSRRPGDASLNPPRRTMPPPSALRPRRGVRKMRAMSSSPRTERRSRHSVTVRSMTRRPYDMDA